MADQKKQSFVQGAAMLTAAVVIVKVIGALYKIPLGNILGDEGMGYFGSAYNIYSLLLTISTAGLPVALSRMVSEANALGKRQQMKRTFTVARTAFFVFGLVATLLMMIFPNALARAIDNPAAAKSIFVLGPSVLLCCLMSAYRGYTQGLTDMVPTSVSQVLEVLGKLVFGLALAWIFIDRGLDLPTASSGAIAGVTIGSFAALVYIVFYTQRMEKRIAAPTALPDVPENRGRIFAKLLKIGIPVTIGSAVLNIIALIDTKLILNRLQFGAGFSLEEANILYGVYFKVQTLFNLPSAFVVPLTVSAIPAISTYIAKKQFKDASQVTGAAVKLCALLGMPMALGMSVLSEPIMNVLYPGSNEQGPALLAILGIASFFVCLTMMTNAILQAYGHERVPVWTMPIGGAVKIILNWVLIGNAAIGVRGAAYSSVACYVVISIINIIIISLRVPERPSFAKAFVRPFIATLVMGAAAWLAYFAASAVIGTGSSLAAVIAMGAAIVFACIVYAIMIIVIRAVTKEELELVPKGDKIAKLLKIR